MVVRIVENHRVADLDEAAAERGPQMVLGEDLVGWPEGDEPGREEEHELASSRVVEVVGRPTRCSRRTTSGPRSVGGS